MELREVLKARRSIRQYTGEAIPEDTIRDILSYAPWVPNHHVSEPWRFVVAQGPSLEELADLRHQAVLRRRAGEDSAQARADKARQEFLDASAVIAVIQRLDENSSRRQEDYASVAMATYNIILAAWDAGIGAFWNTGPLMQDADVRAWLDLREDEQPAAFLRLGYPKAVPVQRRTPIDERVQWRR